MLSALVLATVSAHAVINPIGPFVGSMNDDFESYQDYNSTGGLGSLAVMGGGATFASNGGAQVWIYDVNVATWGLGGYGSALTTSGDQGLGLYNNGSPIDVNLNFTTAVKRFGGYMASDSNLNGITTVDFYDAAGALMGSDTFGTGSNAMVWFGWESTGNGIASIKFGNNLAPVMDDIQADVVPEPATLLAFGLGALALRRRRRS
ncbi:MAG: PEP-CTERM sorting domain-containing protein [Armatimonadetes bacterium]|nr:PEP-CTERM sorting domain-containing protein [Armatimonadota bacterium]